MKKSRNERGRLSMQKEISNLIKVPLYILAFILLGLIFGYLTFKVLSFSRTVEVPTLYGKNLIEANELLTKSGLYLKIEGEDYDSNILPGHILKQDIPAGKKIKEGRGIKVILSKGPRVQSIPMLVNETLSNAEYLLLQKGLKIAKVMRLHSDTVEKDRIIAQKPEPNEKVSDRITVLVSLGPHEVIYYCPDFKGITIDEAKELIERLNLKIETGGHGNNVRAQKPKSGTYVKTGDTIYLQLE
ncbi:MAG: PASTA domain-containing protein [Thermodesulfovibrionales bacterium]|nr:PASTA domain-containing protein [Thermodesulfovibrionales bacterium]